MYMKGERDMWKIRNYWRKQSFTRQISIVFILLFTAQIILLAGISNTYLTDIIENKIMGFFRIAVEQAASNISTTLNGYEESINQLTIDEEFLDCMYRFGESQGQEEMEMKQKLRTQMRMFMSYRPQVWCMAVESENGKIFSSDRLQIDSLYQKNPRLYEQYFSQVEKQEILKGEWLPTEYFDRQGTSDYYLFTYRKRLMDFYTARYVGTFLMGVNELVLSDICQEAQITPDRSTNYNFIVDRDNRIISHYDKSRIGACLNDMEGWKQAVLDEGVQMVKENNEDKVVVLIDIPKTSWRLAGVLDNDYIVKEIRDFQKIIWMITLCLMVLGGFFIWILSRRLSASVKQVVNTMKEVRGGEMSAHMEMEGKNEISIIANQFNKMMKKINNQMDEIKQAGEKEKEAEIRALEAQINPHFIYNTLDSIHWLAIENGEDEISEMLSEFAQILRYQISGSNAVVELKDELEYLKKYLFLQKIRFMDNFEYTIDCEEGILDSHIHKMIFQPLIENAIIHGYANIRHGGYLRINIYHVDEDKICFSIMDNGRGMSPEKVHEVFGGEEDRPSIGVSNVVSRLKLYYGENYRLEVHSGENKGTSIEIIIPRM